MTLSPLRALAFLVLGLFALNAEIGPQGLGVASAAAAKKKKSDKKDEKKDEKKAADKKDDKAAEKGEEKKDEALRTTGPASIKRDAFSAKQFDNSAKADKKRDEQIEEIKGLLPKMHGKSQEGELIFRLAEIYWDKSKFAYQTEFKEFDDAYQRWVDGGRQGKEPQLTAFAKKSEAYKKQALDNYGIVLEKFPDYPRLDEVLYIMAFNQYEAGKTKEAVDNYSQLIRQYQDSEYVSDAYLALGEHYFKANDLTKSTKAYKKAYDIGEAKKRPSVSNYALYKLAWCDYNAQTYDDALSKFKDVIRRSGKSDTKTGDTEKLQLKREALNDMVLTYSQLDKTKDAYEYLKKEAGAQEGYRLTTKLAAVYKEQGKHPLQIETLRLLINLDPDHTSSPDYQSQIVAAYSQMGDRANVRKEITRLVELYRPGSSWWRKNESNSTAVERARAIAESRMREMVTDYHRYAQKFKKVEDYEVARDIYAQYLQAFPDSDSSYRLNFFYAELLWDLGQWREAAAQYDAVVKRDAKGEYTKTCAYNAVLAWEKIVNKVQPPPVSRDGKLGDISGCSEDDEKKGKCKKRKEGEVKGVNVQKLTDYQKGKKYEAEKIPDDEVALANACDAYVAVMGTDWKKDKKIEEELIVVKFKAGYIYQGHNHFDEAAKRFGELIAVWPDNEYARKGADQILDSYDAREDYLALEKWSRTFSDNKTLMKEDKFAKLVVRFMEGATFKNADAVRAKYETLPKGSAEKSEAALAAAGKFEGFVKEFPKSEFASIATYNVQLLYANEEQIDNAIVWAERILKEFPKEITTNADLKKANAEETTYANLAAYYEKVAQYKTAADWYVKFADKYKDNPKSPDSIYNAGIFHLGLGDTDAAVKLFARYIKDFPKQKDIPDVYLRMAAVYEDKEDWKRTAAMYGEFEKLHGRDAKPEQVLMSRYKTAIALQKAGRDKDMLDICDGILSGWKKLDDKVKKSDTGVQAGGFCGFHMLEREWQDYKAIKIEQKAGVSGRKGMKMVAEALDTKKKKRDEVAKKYFDLKDYGSAEWAIAGLLRAADALLDYVTTLRAAPVPPALANNPEATDLFMAELENIAFPVEEQAITALEAALDAAFQKGVYSSYTIELEDRLRKFKPAKFGRIYELPFFPSAAVSAPTRTAAR
ncbi:MAG: tetratricopeptide repeat protein [Deltaproteobacteria bacterium]|nr:tetratricopeptide repeat protein [Deltaproteobacteria bacterium]